jgi:hypothetical protein
MSELQRNDNRIAIRWSLLTSASALALTAHIAASEPARAEDADRPTVWIELSGQLSHLQDGQEAFAPPFTALTPTDFEPPQKAERPPRYGSDERLKFTFQPEGSDWNFSAAIRYGRASSGGHVRHQSYPAGTYPGYRNLDIYYYSAARHIHQNLHATALAARYTDAVTKQRESQLVLDFQAGKDVGLGLFGSNTTSSVSAGVRFAQFVSKSRSALREDPDWAFKPAFYSFTHTFYHIYRTVHVSKLVIQPYHMFSAHFDVQRSFSGLGPSLVWEASVPFVGNPHDGALSFDWGVNAALLFGRQKTRMHRQTAASYHEAMVSLGFIPGTRPGTRVPVYDHHSSPERSRNVTVPNLGGFAGISFKYAAANVSFGYRADFFFGAIDGGIDTRKTYDRNFYGPFAAISIGLGG